MSLRAKSKGRPRLTPVIAALLAALVSATAHTQGTASKDQSFEVQLFQHALTPGSFLTIDSAEVPAHKQFGLGLAFNYQRNPFSLHTVEGDGQLGPATDVVRNQVVTELVGAIGLLDRFQLGIGIPLTLLLDGDGFDERGSPTEERSGFGFGDIRLEGKVRVGTLGPDQELVFSVAPGISVPTGASDNFLGDKNVTGRLRGLAELRRGDFRAGGMLGLLVRQESQIFAATVGNQLLYGAAAAYQIHPQVSAVLELFGRSGLADFSERWVDANPVELDAAVRVAATSMIAVTVGGGTGLIKGIGSPKARGFVVASWTPDFRDRDRDGVYDIDDKCPDQAEDRDGYRDSDGCADADNDGDGILDAQDRCVNDAEDLDQFEDEDGCPEADNDKDGIADINDPCPNALEDGHGKKPKDGCPSTAEDSDGDTIPDTRDKCADDPEDHDAFEDEDGCPDPDNDGDGMPDNFDSCPVAAEDADGFEDEDGCPDPDNDGDGFADGQDKCPMQPETLNGSKDDDGCPDPGNPIVRLGSGKIEVDERIGFVSKAGRTEVKDATPPVLGLVALVLKAHPEITKLRVEVRADGVTKEDTQARAEAVVAALLAKGVEASRLVAAGMGGGGNRVDFVVETTAAPRRKGQAAAGVPEGTPP